MLKYSPKRSITLALSLTSQLYRRFDQFSRNRVRNETKIDRIFGKADEKLKESSVKRSITQTHKKRVRSLGSRAKARKHSHTKQNKIPYTTPFINHRSCKQKPNPTTRKKGEGEISLCLSLLQSYVLP